MANLRDIRNRIKSVKNTSQITRAMQLVASSKMRKAQDAALQGRDYAELLARMIVSIVDRLDENVEYSHPFMEKREIKHRGILVVTTEKGLCGPLNSNLFREIQTKTDETAKFFSIGRKGTQFLSRTRRNLIADFSVSDAAKFSEVRPILETMLKAFTDKEIDTVEVLYPRFKNTLVQEPHMVSFLPLVDLDQILADIVKDVGDSGEASAAKDERDMIFEPSPREILDELLQRYIRFEIYQLILESKASEHSARMVAMKTATDNAKSLVGDLTLEYNKARQASITQEILEISNAAAASTV